MKRCERLLTSYQRLSGKAADAFTLHIDADHQQLKHLLLNILDHEKAMLEEDARIFAYLENWSRSISARTDTAAFLQIVVYDIFVNECVCLTPLAFLDSKEGLIFYKLDMKNIPEVLTRIKRFFKKFINFDFHFSAYAGLPERIICRIDSIRDWYFKENGPYLQYLIDTFQDTVSQLSFISYLKQRFLAKIHADQDIVYPVKPPDMTRGWREQRLARAARLPRIEGVSENELKFYYETTFILEQYAIENIIGAAESDIVIDAGGFVGDTAMYFAQRCGASGKVYSFEPIPRIVEIAKKNVALNAFEGVIEVVPAALSDRCGKFEFMDLASGSRVTDPSCPQASDAVHLVTVDSITLDAFMEANKVPRADFIKSDLEGWDMAFLRGAEETIKTFNPKCGLTLYHKAEDILEIPQFLQRMNGKYKFWFRSETEPVLFAQL